MHIGGSRCTLRFLTVLKRIFSKLREENRVKRLLHKMRRSPSTMVWFFIYYLAISTSTASASKTEKAIKSLETTLERKFNQLIGVVNATAHKTSNSGPGTSGFRTCKEIYDNHFKTRENRAYLLQMQSGKVLVYCHMTSIGLGACGGGGWTLVMKTDGHKPTFHFNSKLWSNKVNFNLPGGKTGIDAHETKLPTYWNTPFSKICLGMKIGHEKKFVVLVKQAKSLHSLISDGLYRPTTLGRNNWKSLIGSEASLQPNCNQEGFNTKWSYSDPKLAIRAARIGILGNEQNDCNTCDSRIGFGTGGYPDDTNTCGNEALAGNGADNGDKHIKAMGYIFVQ